jgi:hypothetical protein
MGSVDPKLLDPYTYLVMRSTVAMVSRLRTCERSDWTQLTLRRTLLAAFGACSFEKKWYGIVQDL